MDEEEAGEKSRRAQAQREKEAGNAAYKARQFEAAIAHYDKAAELDPDDISFLTNRCARARRSAAVVGAASLKHLRQRLACMAVMAGHRQLRPKVDPILVLLSTILGSCLVLSAQLATCKFQKCWTHPCTPCISDQHMLCRAAVHFEMGQFEECIKDCDAAVERGREVCKTLSRSFSSSIELHQQPSSTCYAGELAAVPLHA